MEHFEGIESYSVKYLPIVKAYADRLGLVELINHLIPSEMDLPPGVYFLGMVLDTLSGRNPLYGLEHFFEDQDSELLLGKEVDAKRFNDVNVGRFLDKVFDVGAVKIFKEISMLCVDRNVPVFGKIEDGNASDKSVNNDVLSEILKYMAAHGLGTGDQAFVAYQAAARIEEHEATKKPVRKNDLREQKRVRKVSLAVCF